MERSNNAEYANNPSEEYKVIQNDEFISSTKQNPSDNKQYTYMNDQKQFVNQIKQKLLTEQKTLEIILKELQARNTKAKIKMKREDIPDGISLLSLDKRE